MVENLSSLLDFARLYLNLTTGRSTENSDDLDIVKI